MLAKWFILLAGAALLAFTQGLQTPRIGFALDAAGNLRSLRGIGGNFLWSEPVLPVQVRDAKFSRTRGVAVVQESAILFGSSGEVIRTEPLGDETNPIAGFSEETPVLWFNNQRNLVTLHDRESTRVELYLPQTDRVLALCGEGRVVTLAVARDAQVFLVGFDSQTGAALSSSATNIAAAPKNLLLLPARIALWADGPALAIQALNRDLLSLELDGSPIESLRQLNLEWIQATTAQGLRYAIRMPDPAAGRPVQKFLIPAVEEN